MPHADTLLLLHGMGTGDPEGSWADVLNDSLARLGYPGLDHIDVVAPQYADLLEGIDDDVPVPKVQVRPLRGVDAKRHRREVDRQRTAIERLLGPKPEPKVYRMPDAAVALGARMLQQADNYVNDNAVRGAVLTRVFDAMPDHGRMIIVGHSLGSLVAADLLLRLPRDVEVAGLVTIGSPLAHDRFSIENFLKSPEVPPANLEWWANFRAQVDPVTAGGKLSRTIPWVLGREIPGRHPKTSHYASEYLRSDEVAKTIGYGLFGARTTDIAAAPTSSDEPLDPAEAMILAALRYAHLICGCMKDGDKHERYGDALRLVQAEAVDRVLMRRIDEQRPLPASFTRLAVDLTDPTSAPPEPWLSAATDAEAVLDLLIALAQINPLGDFEIAVADEVRTQAMGLLTFDMELGTDYGASVVDTINEADKVVNGANWIRALPTGGTGTTLPAPVSLMLVAAAASTTDAAAVRGLASFGPGGLIGGLLAARTLTSIGGQGVALGLAAPATDVLTAEAWLGSHLAATLLRQRRGEELDTEMWPTLLQMRDEIERRLGVYEPLSDSSSPGIKQMRRKQDAVERTINFMQEHHLAPDDPTSDPTQDQEHS